MASWTSRRGSCKDSLQGSFSSPRIFAILRWIFFGGFLRIFQGSSMVFRNHFFLPLLVEISKDPWRIFGIYKDSLAIFSNALGIVRDLWRILGLSIGSLVIFHHFMAIPRDPWRIFGISRDSWQFIGDFEGSLKDSWDLRGFFSHFEPF